MREPNAWAERVATFVHNSEGDKMPADQIQHFEKKQPEGALQHMAHEIHEAWNEFSGHNGHIRQLKKEKAGASESDDKLLPKMSINGDDDGDNVIAKKKDAAAGDDNVVIKKKEAATQSVSDFEGAEAYSDWFKTRKLSVNNDQVRKSLVFCIYRRHVEKN